MSKANYAQAVVKSVDAHIPIRMERVGGSTGAFEIILIKDGKEQLLHSKLSGQGFLNNDNKEAFTEKLKGAL